MSVHSYFLVLNRALVNMIDAEFTFCIVTQMATLTNSKKYRIPTKKYQTVGISDLS